MLVCDQCGTGVLSPFPDPITVSSFYRETFYTDDGSRFRGWVENLRMLLGRLRGRSLNSLCPSKGRLLDFGSGAGHFATAQKINGWDVDSIDPYSSVASEAKKCLLTTNGIKLLYEDQTFDAITLWYVIEHLRNPQQAMSEFARVLKHGGVLILAQQDMASVQAKLFGANWLYLDPPRHLWQFSAESIAQLGRLQGLRVVKLSWSNLEMGPFCILQSTLNILLGNNNDLFRFLKNRNLSVSGNRNGKPRRNFQTAASLLLLPIIGPLSFALYLGLLCIRSGDIVTVYFRK